MSNNSNSPMNIVEVNLNNKGNDIQKINPNIIYHEINAYNYKSNKETDNSGDGLSNDRDEAEEEKEQEEEELSMAEIEHLKKYISKQCYVRKNMQIYILRKIRTKNHLRLQKKIPKKAIVS
jgi:ribosomal protein L40E